MTCLPVKNEEEIRHVVETQHSRKRIRFFGFGSHLKAVAASCLCKDVIKEIWNGFCFLSSDIEMTATEEPILLIGEAQPLPLDDYAYTIHVTQTGVALTAKDEQSLLHGYLMLLEHIEAVDSEQGLETFRIACGFIKDKPAIEKRMVHCCVFPETTVEFLEKFIRICGAMKYNYFILEFWGMLQFDCLKELGWEFALTKNQVRNLLHWLTIWAWRLFRSSTIGAMLRAAEISLVSMLFWTRIPVIIISLITLAISGIFPEKRCGSG